MHSGLCAECDIQLQCGGTTVRCTQPPPNEDEPTLPWCARCLSPNVASAVWFPRWAHYRRQLNATSEYGIWLLYSREFRLCIQRALGPVCRVRHPTAVRWHHRQMHAATTQRGRTHTAVVCSVSKSECRIHRVVSKMGPLSSPVECNIRVRHLAAVFV